MFEVLSSFTVYSILAETALFWICTYVCVSRQATTRQHANMHACGQIGYAATLGDFAGKYSQLRAAERVFLDTQVMHKTLTKELIWGFIKSRRVSLRPIAICQWFGFTRVESTWPRQSWGNLQQLISYCFSLVSGELCILLRRLACTCCTIQ